MAETLTRLNPVDVAKSYPQWGHVVDPLTNKMDWLLERQTNSVNFRETNGPFDQDAIYEVVIYVPGFPEPFRSRMKGAQIAGYNAERQANYPFGRIPELPIYYLVTP